MYLTIFEEKLSQKTSYRALLPLWRIEAVKVTRATIRAAEVVRTKYSTVYSETEGVRRVSRERRECVEKRAKKRKYGRNVELFFLNIALSRRRS